ncbi:MAG: hypothetical protein R2719_14505 [Micropruina sp.]
MLGSTVVPADADEPVEGLVPPPVGDGEPLGAGVVPSTGWQAFVSAATAAVNRSVTFSSAVGSTVTPADAFDPDAVPELPEPELPEPELPEPELPDRAVEVDRAALLGFCAEYSAAFACATEVSACSTASCSGPLFTVASMSPARTVPPTLAATLRTVPSTPKTASAVFVRVTVPEAV